MGESPMPDATAEDHFLSPPIPSGILVYDGDCGFCTATARWAQRRLSDDYQVVPAQQFDLGAHSLTEEDVARSAWWIDPDGTCTDEHRCIAKALRAMRAPWPALGRLLTLGPISPFARWTYRFVAKNRYRLPRFGSPAKCER